jgi:hypothetical protein
MGWDTAELRENGRDAGYVCGMRSDTARWVGCMCVCTGIRVRKWRCSECVGKWDLYKIYVNKKEKGNCACVHVCACMRASTLKGEAANIY